MEYQTHRPAAGHAPGESPRLQSARMVGRDVELATVLHALTDPPAVVLIAGEAGVGKSRLVHEMRNRHLASPRPILVGCCDSLRNPLPFAPVVEALSHAEPILPQCGPLSPLTGVLRPLLPELSDHLPPTPMSTGDASTDRHRLFRAVAELLSRMDRPIAVLEDLHWADPATLDMIRYLARQLPGQLSLVLTYRDEELPRAQPYRPVGGRLPSAAKLVEVKLEPLTTSQTHELIAGILATGDVSEAFTREVHERTAGLPFAVEEVMRLLGDRHDVAAGDRWQSRQVLDEIAVPPALRDFVLERIDRLAPDTRRIVHAAAVSGAAMTEDGLATIAGLSPARATRALCEAVDRAVLAPEGSGWYAFRHALARQAAYGSIAAPQRRRLHARAADVLRATQPKAHARLAHHCRQSGRMRAWQRHAEAAADVAAAVGDNTMAAGYLRDLLSTPSLSAATRARTAVKLARACVLGVPHADIVTLLIRTLNEARLPVGDRGEIRLHLGLIMANQGSQHAAGNKQINHAVKELARRPDLAARALSALSVPDHATGHVSHQLDAMRKAVALLPRLKDPAVRLAVLVNQATTLLCVGDPGAWRLIEALPERAPGPAEHLQLARGANNFANNSVMLGHYDRAQCFLEWGARLLARHEAEYSQAFLTSVRLELDYATGRWASLGARLGRLAEVDSPLIAGQAELLGGLLDLARADVITGERRLRSAYRLCGNPIASVQGAAMCLSGLLRILLSRAEVVAACQEIERLLPAVRQKGIWVWLSEAALPVVDALIRAGRVDAARDLVEEFTDGLTGRDAPLASAAVEAVRARLREAEGRYVEATEAFADAADRYRQLPRPYEAAQAVEAMARCRFAAGGDAAAQATAALYEYEALGAAWDAARCRSLLREHGVTLTQRRGRRGYGSALSPREREVAQLAIRGRTNREIAAALQLSKRTVEEHVARAIRKLGVASRTELHLDLATQEEPQ